MTCLSAAGRPGSTASKEDTKLKTRPYLQLLHLSVVHIYLSGTLSLFVCMLLVEPILFSTVCGGKKCSRHLVSLSRALGALQDARVQSGWHRQSMGVSKREETHTRQRHMQKTGQGVERPLGCKVQRCPQ